MHVIPRDHHGTRWLLHERSRQASTSDYVSDIFRLHGGIYFCCTSDNDLFVLPLEFVEHTPTMDPQMNKLLKWSVQNTQQQNEDGTTTAPPSADQAARNLTPEMINTLFGGPSEADLMKAAMEVLHSDESDLENKLIAFDNFEQLIESIDNANNLEPLGLWTPLVQLLKHEEAEMRRMAAWCIGTAVQNNEKAQDKVCSHEAHV